MAEHGKRAFANELHILCTALEQAGRSASSLKELHDAEVCDAVAEVTGKIYDLKHQLSLSQQETALPHEINQSDSVSKVSDASAKIIDLTEQPSPRLRRKVLPPLTPADISGDSHSSPQEGKLVAEDSKPLWGSEPLRKLSRHTDDVETASPGPPKAKEGRVVSVQAPDEVPGARPSGSIERAQTTMCISPSLSPSKRNCSTHQISIEAIRDVWQDVDEEAVTLMSSRCTLQALYYDEMEPWSLRLSRQHSQMNIGFAESLHLREKAARMSRCCVALFCGMMDPVGLTRCSWNAMCLLLIACDLFLLPMQAFHLDDVQVLQGFEWVSTVWWTFDVYMSFRTGYIVGSRVEMRPRMIAAHYARTWLLCDIVIVVLEWVNRVAVAFGSVSLLRTSRALRTFRFMRLFRVTKMHAFWKALHDQVNSNVLHLCITLSFLGAMLLLTIHITSCIWYALGESRDDGWITYDIYPGEKDHLFWYIASVRWVISQFNGRTDMDERRNLMERLFTCTVGVSLALVAQALFISVITKSMLDLSEIVSEKTRRNRVVNEYLEANPLPPLLTSQVKQCLCDYQDAAQELKKEDEVMGVLPRHLQSDVIEQVRAPVLMLHPFFNALRYESPWVMRFLCRKVLQTVSASKDEVLFDKGDKCDRMLFTDKLTAMYGQPLHTHGGGPSTVASSDDLRGGVDVVGTGGFLKRPKALNRYKQKQKSRYGNELLDIEDNKSQLIPMGGWISEAALWVEWKNQGRFVVNGHGVLLAVQASKLAQSLKEHQDAFALAHIYANTFKSEIQEINPLQLSDLLPFEIQLHSPLCVDLTVISASGLRNADGFFSGKSDPYCICKVIGVTGKSGETRFKTAIIDNSLEPVWNHHTQLYLSWHQVLEFQIWDYDFGKKDTSLGVARISPADFVQGFEGDILLRDPDGSVGQGSVRLKIQLVELEEPASLHLWFSGAVSKKLKNKRRSRLASKSSTFSDEGTGSVNNEEKRSRSK